ncbi:MAG TPA: LysR family transcriptional regulator [Steroidobacteraceae bacterium]|nr:LysR family transcriptional regulator [Steroidobacteraceae bacterium]
MRLDRLDLNQLICLDALLAERSVTKAAERVFLSPSAMSCALTRLRQHFEDDILVQIGRSMRATPFAESLAKPVQNLILQARALAASRPHFRPEEADGTIRIVCSDYITSVLLMDITQRAWTEAPGLKFEMRPFSPSYQEELERGDADLLIGTKGFVAPDHPSESLFDDHFVCVVWEHNSIVGEQIKAEDFVSLGHVVPMWGHGLLGSLGDELLKSMGVIRRVELTVPSFTHLAQAVIGTNRIAALQGRLARAASTILPIRVLKCPIDIPPFTEVVQWHSSRTNDPSITWCRDLIVRVARASDHPSWTDHQYKRENKIRGSARVRPSGIARRSG